MLERLVIKDFVMLKNVDLSLNNGLTMITGETGSGKSLMLSAIRLAFGARGDVHMVRPGASEAVIGLTINIQKLPEAQAWLKATTELPQPTITLERTIFENGRSKFLVNKKPVTASDVKTLADHCLQMHGQHEQQRLLKSTQQRGMVDGIADHSPLLQKVQAAYQQWKDVVKVKKALLAQGSSPAELSLLRYQVDEYKTLSIQEDEWEALSLHHRQLANVDAHHQACDKALSLLEGEDGHAIVDALRTVSSTIAVLEAGELRGLLDSAELNLQEAIANLKQQQSTLVSNPQALQETESRLSALFDLARKHHIEPAALYGHGLQLKEQLLALDNMEDKLAAIDGQIASALQNYQKVANKLSSSRKKAAQQLQSQVTEKLQHLGMAGACFSIALTQPPERKPEPSGQDEIVFMAQTNPDQPSLELSKVASGGELSRIALAIQATTAKKLKTPSLIFDEIDVGIGGNTANAIGSALVGLSQEGQVICITHLPQVAAFAHHHINVSKVLHKKQTFVEIVGLEGAARVSALAAMLGDEKGASAKAHAQSLIQQASELV